MAAVPGFPTPVFLILACLFAAASVWLTPKKNSAAEAEIVEEPARVTKPALPAEVAPS